MLSAMALLHLTLSDLEGSSQGHQDLKLSLISCKGAQLGPMLLLYIDRKPYMGSSMTS